MKIYSENKKQKLNITLSVKICQQDNTDFFNFLKKLQVEMVKCIPLNCRIHTYIYPEDTIHFSLINFLSFELDVDFNQARKVIELQEWYSGFKNYISDNIMDILPPIITFKFEKFYKNPDNSIKGSVTINIKSDEDKKLQNALGEIKIKVLEKLKKLKLPINNLEIKDHNKGSFAINLLRFFGEEDGLVGESDDLEKLIEENKGKFLKLKVTRPIVVISDQYLSNDNPQIIPKLP